MRSDIGLERVKVNIARRGLEPTEMSNMESNGTLLFGLMSSF
jgi:hypothetical protein